LIVEPSLRVGDLVTPARASPAFREKHGFGVITEIISGTQKSENVITYEVKFVKSLRAFRFGFDAVVRYE
jgi:hypothetical protein